MVCYSLNPENSTKSCKSRDSNLHAPFKNTCETAQAIKGMHIWKTTKYLKDVTLQKQHACHSIIKMVEVLGMHRPDSGAGHWVSSPKRVLNFYCTCSKMQSHAELKGLDADSRCRFSGHWAHPGEQGSQGVGRTYRGHRHINPDMSSPCPTEMILTEKEQMIVPKPEEELVQKKKIPGKKTEETNNLWPQNKCCKKKKK